MNKYILYTNTKEIHGESIDNDKIFNHEIGNFLESSEMNADVYDEFDNLESALDAFDEINAECGVFLSHLPLHLSTKLMKTATLLTVMQ